MDENKAVRLVSKYMEQDVLWNSAKTIHQNRRRFFFDFYRLSHQFTNRGKSIAIHLDGDKDMICNLKIIKVADSKIEMKVLQQNEILKPHKKN